MYKDGNGLWSDTRIARKLPAWTSKKPWPALTSGASAWLGSMTSIGTCWIRTCRPCFPPDFRMQREGAMLDQTPSCCPSVKALSTCSWYDMYTYYYRIGKNFCGKNISCVKFLLHLIFVCQATELFFVVPITHFRQVLVRLIFVGSWKLVSHKNFFVYGIHGIVQRRLSNLTRTR